MVGGAAGVGFLIICLLFARSVLKKKDGEQLIMANPILVLGHRADFLLCSLDADF